MKAIAVFVAWIAAIAVAGWAMRRWTSRRRALARSFAEVDVPPPAREASGPLSRWLHLAGYRRRNAARWMVTIMAAALGLGTFGVVTFERLGGRELLLSGVELIPGGVGDLFVPIAILAPWIVFLLLASLPILSVRAARRRRVTAIEQDLPLMLDLLATLGEAGLGIDAGISRVLEARERDRPLPTELRSFQGDLLSGRPRVESLRRLARRIEVPAVSIFVAALVQAEQTGMGIAHVLRTQADELRNRRRERADAFAQTLAVKRMFPLVICFLPAIFLWTLGPFFAQLFLIADTFIHRPGGP